MKADKVRGRRMRHRYSKVQAWLSVAVALLATLATPALAQSAVGYVQVKAAPGIQVLLDGTLQGITNADVGGLILQDVPAGRHELALVKSGFQTQKATVEVTAGQVLVYAVKPFEPKLNITQQGAQEAGSIAQQVGTLVIQTLPVDASIDIPALRQQPIKKTRDILRIANIPVGPYGIVGTSLGKQLTQKLGVCPGTEVHLFMNFAASPPTAKVTAGRTWPGCAAGATKWLEQFGGPASDGGGSVATGPSGAIYVAGSTSGTLGNASSGGQDVVLAKLDGSGKRAWVRQFGTAGADWASAVAVGQDGAIYVAGSLDNTSTEALHSNAHPFLARFDPSGHRSWLERLGGSAEGQAQAVAVDSAGDVYVAGGTSGAFPGQRNAGGFDVFLAKYSPTGTLSWARQFGGANRDFGMGVAVGPDGAVYLTGNAQMFNAGIIMGFLAKYDASGNRAWLVPAGDRGNTAFGVTVGPHGGVFVTGMAGGGATSQAIVVAFNSDGQHRWTRKLGSYAEGLAIASDARGDVIVGGATRGTFAGQTSAGNFDGFAAKLGADGSTSWLRQFGSSLNDMVTGVSSDGTGGVIVAGATGGSLPGNTGAGKNDVLVGRFGP